MCSGDPHALMAKACQLNERKWGVRGLIQGKFQISGLGDRVDGTCQLMTLVEDFMDYLSGAYGILPGDI